MEGGPFSWAKKHEGGKIKSIALYTLVIFVQASESISAGGEERLYEYECRLWWQSSLLSKKC